MGSIDAFMCNLKVFLRTMHGIDIQTLKGSYIEVVDTKLPHHLSADAWPKSSYMRSKIIVIFDAICDLGYF